MRSTNHFDLFLIQNLPSTSTNRGHQCEVWVPTRWWLGLLLLWLLPWHATAKLCGALHFARTQVRNNVWYMSHRTRLHTRWCLREKGWWPTTECIGKFTYMLLIKVSPSSKSVQFLNYLPLLRRNLTSSTWPSWAASMSGVEQPSSMSAPTSMRNLATSKKPPQQARVRAVSWVSSVWASMFAPAETKHN